MKNVLVCHPATLAPAARGIEVLVKHGPDGHLALSYALNGDFANLAIPDPQLPGPADCLWEHTCFEAFIAIAGEAAYREFNFSPSGQWAAYAFSDYRQRDDSVTGRLASTVVLRSVTRALPGRLVLDAIILPAALPYSANGANFVVGLSAVVEATDGSRSYWALRHPSARPDFHHRDAFVLELAASRNIV